MTRLVDFSTWTPDYEKVIISLLEKAGYTVSMVPNSVTEYATHIISSEKESDIKIIDELIHYNVI